MASCTQAIKHKSINGCSLSYPLTGQADPCYYPIGSLEQLGHCFLLLPVAPPQPESLKERSGQRGKREEGKINHLYPPIPGCWPETAEESLGLLSGRKLLKRIQGSLLL